MSDKVIDLEQERLLREFTPNEAFAALVNGLRYLSPTTMVDVLCGAFDAGELHEIVIQINEALADWDDDA